VNADEDAVEDENCGCVILHEEVDGQQVAVHHQIPDDCAPHSATSECGCGPEVFHEGHIRVYLHLDQDHDEDLDWGPDLPD
jgi:hypothetical protein